MTVGNLLSAWAGTNIHEGQHEDGCHDLQRNRPAARRGLQQLPQAQALVLILGSARTPSDCRLLFVLQTAHQAKLSKFFQTLQRHSPAAGQNFPLLPRAKALVFVLGGARTPLGCRLLYSTNPCR